MGGGSRERLVNGYNVIVRLGKFFLIFCSTQNNYISNVYFTVPIIEDLFLFLFTFILFF